MATTESKSKVLPERVDAQKVAGVRFKELGDRCLLTNDWGRQAVLSRADFRRYLEGKLCADDAVYRDLQAKGFIRDQLDFQRLTREFREANAFLLQGPSLHIIVVTLRCNHKCLYCHSSAVNPARTDTDMTLETARSVVDAIFKSPSPKIVIEFQGGEPLMNWPVVQFAVRYAKARNQVEKKNLVITLVSNMSLMDDEKLAFLLENEVSLCTSLDGPQDPHDRNRIILGGGSYSNVVRWLEKLNDCYEKEQSPRRRIFKPSALMTTTRFSLPRWKEIIDEYARLGLDDIFLRPLSPIGYAKKVWPKIGYTSAEYLEFYRRGLDYILQKNLEGKAMAERYAAILLTKILRGRDHGFVDLRSPCGAGTGQLAYNYDGGVYTCDEGRMVAQQGSDIFKMGDVRRTSYREMIDSPACRVLCAASTMDGQPACNRCVYKPYCGVCPVHNYEAQGAVWGRMPAGDYCAVHMGIFDLLFERMERPEYLKIFQSWIEPRREGCEHGCAA